MIPDTRASLLIRLRNPEDDDAWTAFSSLYTRVLIGFFRNRGLDALAAQEVTQDVLCSVFRSIESLDYNPDIGRFRDWLFLIARRRMADFLRKRERMQKHLEPAARQGVIAALAAPNDEMVAAWDAEHQRALFLWASEQVRTQVKPATWDAFWGLAVEHLSVDDVAARTGLSPSSAYMAKSRVIARMKRIIDTASRTWEVGRDVSQQTRPGQ